MEEESDKVYTFKKQIRKLAKYRGSGTQLISIYIPAGYPIHETTGKLREELSQASNIKSKSTRTNVSSALEKIINHLKIYKKTPKRGLVVFAGNISEHPSKTDIELFSLEPVDELKMNIYRCDSKFFLEPLIDMTESKDAYGIVVMDGKDATIAIVKGTQTKIVKTVHSTAPSKVRKGGQCLSEDTLVIKSDGTITEIKNIKPNERIKVCDFKKNKIVDGMCERVYKRNSKNAYLLNTKKPINEIMATDEHVFFVFDNGRIREKSVKELEIGDKLLLSRNLKVKGEKVKIDYMPEYSIKLTKKGREIVLKARNNLGLSQAKVGRELGLHQMSISDFERGIINLEKENLSSVVDFYNVEKKLMNETIKKYKIKVPEYCDKKLAQILGYITGDGNKDGNRIILYESKGELLNHYEGLIKENLGIEAKRNIVNKVGKKGSWAKKPYFELRIYSKDFVELVEKYFRTTIQGSHGVEVPEYIMKSENEVVAGFLRGLFDAEGYISGPRVSLAMVSKKLIQQIQLLLLRFGIIATFSPKKTKGKSPQWYVSIGDRESIIKFERYIGFSLNEKKKKLKEITKNPITAQYSNQVTIEGRQIYLMAKELGLKTRDFDGLNTYFQNKRQIGRGMLIRKIIPVFEKQLKKLKKDKDKRKKAERTLELLTKIAEGDTIVAEIKRKTKIKPEEKFYDLTIPKYENFLANGLIVHNSSARYQRIVEGETHKYYVRIGESMDLAFLDKGIRGVIVGGPGSGKEYFLKEKTFNYQIKILGTVDTGYTDEYGVREVLAKSEEIMTKQAIIKEKKLIDRFIKEVVSGGLATYGLNEVRESIENKKADHVLVSEGIQLRRIFYKCGECGEEENLIIKEHEEIERKNCKNCKIAMQIDEDEPLTDYFIEIAKENKIKVDVISINSAEGAQFLQGFGGIGAFLRYR